VNGKVLVAGTNGYLILFAITSMKRKRRVFYYLIWFVCCFCSFHTEKINVQYVSEKVSVLTMLCSLATDLGETGPTDLRYSAHLHFILYIGCLLYRICHLLLEVCDLFCLWSVCYQGSYLSVCL